MSNDVKTLMNIVILVKRGNDGKSNSLSKGKPGFARDS